MKKRALVPTLLTLGNAVCGLAAIAYASRIGKADSSPAADRVFLAASGWLIMAAMVFDALDGFFARLFKAAGRFGAELDSLCDAISFGAAPAFILLQIGPGRDQPFLHQVLAAVATLYMMCTILRLARYNVEAVEGSKKFKGLPSPAAGGCIAALAIVRGRFGELWPTYDTPAMEVFLEAWAVVGAVVVAVLMVSNVAYPHLTKQMIRGKRGAPLPLVLVLLISVVAIKEATLVLAFWFYAIVFVARAIYIRVTHRDAVDDAVRH